MYTSNNSNKNNNKIVLIHGLQSHRWIYSLFVHVCFVCVIVCAANFTKRDFGWPAEMLENIYPALVFTCSASLSLSLYLSLSLLLSILLLLSCFAASTLLLTCVHKCAAFMAYKYTASHPKTSRHPCRANTLHASYIFDVAVAVWYYVRRLRKEHELDESRICVLYNVFIAIHAKLPSTSKHTYSHSLTHVYADIRQWREPAVGKNCIDL